MIRKDLKELKVSEESRMRKWSQDRLEDDIQVGRGGMAIHTCRPPGRHAGLEH